jgi:CII-binding regulator of phage lambda lysogenization HflD
MGLKEQLVRTSKDHLGSIETKLNGLLKPVTPRPEFVNTLRQRIQITGKPAWVSRFNNMQFIIILLTGVLSGVVIMTMLARVLVNLLVSEKKSSEVL